MVGALVVIGALLAQSGGVRAGRTGGMPEPRPAGAPEAVVNPVGTRLEVVTYAWLQNGQKRETGKFIIDAERGRNEAFVYVPASPCDRSVLSHSQPARAAHGWRIAVAPTRLGVPDDVRAAVSLSWSRAWLNGQAGRSASGAQQLQLDPTDDLSATTVDQLSGNPRMLQLVSRRRGASREPKLLTPTAACAAVDMSLDLRLVNNQPQPIIEAELWLVHTPPKGEETAQRQVTRVRSNGSGEFFFDHIRTVSNNQQVTVLFSGLLEPTITTADKISVRVTLKSVYRFAETSTHRRSMAPFDLNPGEVVSLEMPPSPDVSGPKMDGHKFSVRMRVRPVGEGEN